MSLAHTFMAFADRHRSWLQPLGSVLSLTGFVTFAAYLAQAISLDGGVADDLHAYILAGRHALAGEPLYASVHLGDQGAYRYPPTFAYLAIPLTVPPELVATWLYRAACLACVRYLVGSWRAVGWALLFIPLQIELMALNVTLPIAAVARLSLRGGASGAGLVPATAGLKYGTALLIPYLWLRRRELRRPMLIGMAATALVLGVHVAIDPATWQAFLDSLVQQSASANDEPSYRAQLITLLPSTLWDFVLRFAICVALVAVAAWRGWDWLAFTAAAVAVPTLWLARLGALVGVPRLWWEEELRRRTD